MTNRVAIFLGCSGVAVVAIVVALLLSAWLLHVTEDPDGLWITAEAPHAVKLGEKFTLVIEATNRLSDREIELGDLDIDDTYLKGFALVSVSPQPKSTELDTFNDCTTTRFKVSLPPGATVEFQFDLRAERTGHHRGQVDLYAGMQFVSTVVETVVSR